MRSINLYFTKSLNDVIGRENEFIWFLNKESSDFRERTKDQIILMGKRTWETIPTIAKSNFNSIVVVVTRDRNFTHYQDNVNVVYDLDWYIENYINNIDESRQLWVIGGGQILSQSIKFADTIEINEINETIKGDIKAPKIDGRSFQLLNSTELIEDSFSGLHFFKSYYKRISKSCVKRGSRATDLISNQGS